MRLKNFENGQISIQEFGQPIGMKLCAEKIAVCSVDIIREKIALFKNYSRNMNITLTEHFYGSII